MDIIVRSRTKATEFSLVFMDIIASCERAASIIKVEGKIACFSERLIPTGVTARCRYLQNHNLKRQPRRLPRSSQSETRGYSHILGACKGFKRVREFAINNY